MNQLVFFLIALNSRKSHSFRRLAHIPRIKRMTQKSFIINQRARDSLAITINFKYFEFSIANFKHDP